ncbi:coat protein [ssRNA phage Gephyllon.2_7]|uniref:Coat protein n=2 Tax=Leviviricetes TaxID=2842243 RepID=A0A8S5KYS6_9VIRU|nr:coat protein [ssRNA phage Gephyllon.2_7]QDH90335.1 MAG: hypothetical protein H2BulkLitter12320_000002 [Leviviridae sp.]DAD50472.1 TPA_asm: coat protein [ssRNA phage Gephyllon.2_7]
MAFADPRTLTVAGVAKSLVRILTAGLSSTYQTNDKSYTQRISHQESGTKVRSLLRTDFRAVVADPLTSQNSWQTLSVQTVIDRPLTGFTETQVADLVAAHNAQLDSTTISKLYGEES